MDERTARLIQERLDRVEAVLVSLHGQVSTLSGDVDRLKSLRAVPPPSVARAPVPPPPSPVREIFCPNCLGGNPTNGILCIWCGYSLLSATPPPPPPPTPLKPAIPPPAAERPAAVTILPAPPRARHEVRRVPIPASWKTVLTHARVTVQAPKTSQVATEISLGGFEPTGQAPMKPAAQRAAPAFNFDILGKSEFWLNKVGIGLLLLGLAFFFKYSIDKGWLNEQVRVALGLALGTVLLGFGLATYRERRHFSQVLLGGSIATYYITGYAAYQMLHIVSYELAFGFMAAVTALAFALAIRQDEAILSLIGVAGGLATPFVLENEPTGASGLIVYTCVVLAGASGVYMLRGWRSLLWLAYLGGAAVFAAAYMGTVYLDRGAEADRWALQGGALFGAVAFWAVPVLREWLFKRDPDHWPRPSMMKWAKELEGVVVRHTYLLVIGVPLITLGFSRSIWGSAVDAPTWGWYTLGGAAIYGLVAWLLRRDLPVMAYIHAMMGILLLTLGIVQVLDGSARIFSLAVEGTALHILSRRLSDRGTSVYGHLIWLGTVVWLVRRLAETMADNPGLTNATLTDLAVIVLLGVSSFSVISDASVSWLRHRPAQAPQSPRRPSLERVLFLGAASFVSLSETVVYRNLAHFCVAIWLYAQLSPLSGELPYFMLALLGYALALNIARRWLPALFREADTGYAAHAIFAWAAIQFLAMLRAGHSGELAVFNVNTLACAGFVAAAAITSFIVAPQSYAPAYRIAAHAGVMGLMLRELSVLDTEAYYAGYALLAWAIYLAFMQYLSRRSSDIFTSRAGHVFFLAVITWLGLRFVGNPDPSFAVFSLDSGINLAVIVIAAATSLLVMRRDAARLYRLAAYAGLLGWFWHEFAALPNGSGYTILAWALMAIGVLYLPRSMTLLRRVVDRREVLGASAVGAVTFLAAGTWLGWRLVKQDSVNLPVFNLEALTDLLVIGLAVVACYLSRRRLWAPAYLLGAHLGLMGWFWREYHALPNGSGYVILAWSVLALGVLYLSARAKQWVLSFGGGLLANATLLAAGCWLAWRLFFTDAWATPVLNIAAFTDLLVIACAVAAWYITRRRPWVAAYLLAAHVAFLALIWRELSAMTDGRAYITIVWGAYAIALLVGGLSRGRIIPLIYTGLATLALVVGKLFLVDLREVDPLWRVLLFLGFGGALLMLSYYFQNVIGGKPGSGGPRKPRGFHWPTPPLAH